VRTLGGGSNLYSFLYLIINNSTHLIKVPVNIQVTKPNYLQSVTFQYRSSLVILLFSNRIVMTATIKFNDQFCFKTVKINNIIVNTFLSLKTHGVSL